ncbi:MAG: hypothetical protein K1X79_12135 [Oligoflexia bacterium]|nr:hypothetical protein [Oligoflexia bacterium]
MSDSSGKTFSNSLMSLQLQLKTLLEGVGGERAVEFLDNLSELNPSEQKIALNKFIKVLEQIKNGTERLCTAEDQALRDFENNLYKDILGSMREAANGGSITRRRIEVIDGGKNRDLRKGPINLAEARKNRKIRHKPIVN